MKNVKIAITGTGPSGAYCALQLIDRFNEQGLNAYAITLFDPLPPLATILPTGNGRCNLTFAEYDFKAFASNYPRGEKFLYSIFSRYFVPETLEYFEKIGVKTFIQPDNRVFPLSQSSKILRSQMLSPLLSNQRVKFFKKTVQNVSDLLPYDVIVLATGSKDRHNLAQQFGHTINPLVPSLCGLKIKDKGANFPTGASLPTPNGGVIFTHVGVSGPEIFKISSINAKKSFPYEINVPIINSDKLFAALHEAPKKTFGNVVSKFVPKSVAKFLFEKYEIDFDKQSAHAKLEEVEKLSTLVLTAIAPDGKGEIVHCGGIKLDEVDKNCRSKICKKLWIIGETLDIDGFCGGFNLQNCWSTAAVAANDIANVVLNRTL